MYDIMLNYIDDIRHKYNQDEMKELLGYDDEEYGELMTFVKYDFVTWLEDGKDSKHNDKYHTKLLNELFGAFHENQDFIISNFSKILQLTKCKRICIKLILFLRN